jgi:hypothetical protein
MIGAPEGVPMYMTGAMIEEDGGNRVNTWRTPEDCPQAKGSTGDYDGIRRWEALSERSGGAKEQEGSSDRAIHRGVEPGPRDRCSLTPAHDLRGRGAVWERYG